MAQDIFASSPELDARKRWATRQLEQGSDITPVGHPLAAVARALQGAIGGYYAGKLNDEDKAAGAAVFNSLPGLPSAAPAPQMSAAPAAQPSNYGNAISSIESGGKYDALGPVTKTGDQAYGKYQVMGANVGPWTREILGTEMTPQAFAADPAAQEKVFQGKFGSYVQKYGPEGAARAWFAGEGGMNNPNARDQLGTTVQQYGQRFNNALGPQVASLNPAAGIAPQSPAATPQGPQVAQAGGQPGLPQASPASPMGPQPNRSQVNIPPEVAQTIQRLGADPRTRGQAWQLYMQYAKPVESIQPMTPEQRKQWQIPDGMSAGIDTVTGKPVFSPPQTNVNLNTAQKGQEVMATEATKDFKAAQEAGREAVKRSSVWDTMEQASKGFTPGATADVKLQAKRYLKDLGLIQGEDVPDAEVFKMMQQQLAIHNQPKGQGAVSNYEREMFAKSIPNISMSPEGLARAIQISRKLDSFDRKVAQVYRDNARKNGGVPNSIDINDEIDKLGSPLSQSEMNFIRKGAEGKPTGAASSSSGGVDPAALEEARRRGLIK